MSETDDTEESGDVRPFADDREYETFMEVNDDNWFSLGRGCRMRINLIAEQNGDF